MTLLFALAAAVIQAGDSAPLPAQSPIGGPFWSYVVPALLLLAAFLGTLLLYRHFAQQETPR